MLETIAALGPEPSVPCSRPDEAYRTVIAFHSTRLGPAPGGPRLPAYPSDAAAFGVFAPCALDAVLDDATVRRRLT